MAEPLPLCYLNGDYLPLQEARISPLDRGFLYADGVYEVMPVYAGRPFRFAAHLARLGAQPRGHQHGGPAHARRSGATILGTLIERNGGADQYVYWQVTRGAEFGRNHAPLPKLPRTVFAFCAPLPATRAGGAGTGRRLRHGRGYALVTLRYQVDLAAGERAAAAAGGRRRTPARPSCCAMAS